MYSNYYVQSGLITGTQWDVILNTMINKTDLTKDDMVSDSSKWGNYINNSISYSGRLAKSDYGATTASYWTLHPFGTVSDGNTTSYSTTTEGDLLTTGASSVTEKYHIFDMAGNLWELTEEDSHYVTTGQFRVIRSGSYLNQYLDNQACFRHSISVSSTYLDVGFRVVLYLK